MTFVRRVLPYLLLAPALSCSCGGGTSMELQVASGNHPADGTTAVRINAVLKVGGGVPQTSQSVEFKTTVPGSFAAVTDPSKLTDTQSATTDATGTAPIDLYAGQSGTAHVTATWNMDGAITTQTVDVKFGSSSVGAIQFVSADPPSIQLSGSPGTTSSTLTFKVLDTQNNPVADGVSVAFALDSVLTGTVVDPTSGKTAGGGKVTTHVNAGTVTGSVRVVATVGAINTKSDPISIGGSAVAFSHFDFNCQGYNMGGYYCANLEMNCVATVGDRSGNIVEANVSFRSETPGFMNIKGNSTAQTSNGQAIVNLITQNCNNVDTAKPGWIGTSGLLAKVAGEEAFTDLNGNNQYDINEPFIDLSEPYFDSNENGHWDPGEPFDDLNQNNVFDGPNGKWDANIVVWREVRVACSGKNGFAVSFTPSSFTGMCNSVKNGTVTIQDARAYTVPAFGNFSLTVAGISATPNPNQLTAPNNWKGIDYGFSLTGPAGSPTCQPGQGTIGVTSQIKADPNAGCTITLPGTTAIISP